jgi:hypothetical protein
MSACYVTHFYCRNTLSKNEEDIFLLAYNNKKHSVLWNKIKPADLFVVDEE